MAYRLKVSGINEARRSLGQIAKEYKALIRKLSTKNIELPAGIGTLTFGEINDGVIDDIKKQLLKNIDKAHRYAVRAVTNELSQALDNALDDPGWEWLNGIKRDIVETGALKASKKVYVDSDNDIHILYNAQYAAVVHYGGYVNVFGDPDKTYYYPARPWVIGVLEGSEQIPRFEYEKVYERAFLEFLARTPL
jgi:phage gpG-like protein